MSRPWTLKKVAFPLWGTLHTSMKLVHRIQCLSCRECHMVGAWPSISSSLWCCWSSLVFPRSSWCTWHACCWKHPMGHSTWCVGWTCQLLQWPSEVLHALEWEGSHTQTHFPLPTCPQPQAHPSEAASKTWKTWMPTSRACCQKCFGGEPLTAEELSSRYLQKHHQASCPGHWVTSRWWGGVTRLEPLAKKNSENAQTASLTLP